jgi:hypothetical protein
MIAKALERSLAALGDVPGPGDVMELGDVSMGADCSASDFATLFGSGSPDVSPKSQITETSNKMLTPIAAATTTTFRLLFGSGAGGGAGGNDRRVWDSSMVQPF